jgi:hypothetical protein
MHKQKGCTKDKKKKIKLEGSLQGPPLGILFYSILFHGTEMREKDKDMTKIEETEKDMVCPPYLTDHTSTNKSSTLRHIQTEHSATLLTSKRTNL